MKIIKRFIRTDFKNESVLLTLFNKGGARERPRRLRVSSMERPEKRAAALRPDELTQLVTKLIQSISTTKVGFPLDNEKRLKNLNLITRMQQMLEKYTGQSLTKAKDVSKRLTNLINELSEFKVMNIEDLEDGARKTLIVKLSNWLIEARALHYGEEENCKIETSTIPNAGYGLFATRQLVGATQHDDDPTYITHYGGIYHENEDCLNTLSHYVIANGKHFIDGETGFYLWEMGRWGNTKRMEEECNARFHPDADDRTKCIVCVMDGKTIEPGEEIFIWYSHDFANHLHPVERRLCAMCISAVADRVCGQCELSAYCSERCADSHWKMGGHYVECGK
jgi:hypothetical protein